MVALRRKGGSEVKAWREARGHKEGREGKEYRVDREEWRTESSVCQHSTPQLRVDGSTQYEDHFNSEYCNSSMLILYHVHYMSIPKLMQLLRYLYLPSSRFAHPYTLTSRSLSWKQSK